MNLTDRAQKVLAEIDAALALAEKATPGPWESEGDSVFIQEGDGFTKGIAQTLSGDLLSDATFIATSRTLLPASLRCLRTAIEEMLKWHNPDIDSKLTTLCDQWDALK